MIAVFASGSAWADVQAVAGERRCILVHDHEEMLCLAGDADAVVLQFEDLSSILDFVRHINQEHPLLPIILITERGSIDLRHLASVSVEAVLFRHQIIARLPGVLRVSGGVVQGLRALAEDCMANEVIPPSVRNLLTCTLATAPPPATVGHLARLIHADPSTIRRHWRRGVNSHGIQRVKDLLDWIVLLRAVSLKGSGLSWRLVAEGVGAHESTLRRRAERLAGETLGSLGVLGAQRLVERFTETLRKSFCANLR